MNRTKSGIAPTGAELVRSDNALKIYAFTRCIPCSA
jgi:hypothetical protein